MEKKKTPAKSAEQVLKECGITERPIHLKKVIEKYGILQVDLPANDDIFGAIVQQQGHTIIAVNPNQHPHRQRFTIAHELGHYFHHDYGTEGKNHVDRDFRLHWRNSNSSKGIDWQEIEANRFAASLLMPESFLRRDLERFVQLDTRAIQKLADLYQVSRTAMQYRLINLGILPPDVDVSAS